MGTEVGRSASTSVASLVGGLKKVRGSIKAGGRDKLLRYLQDGNWVFGKDDTEVTKGKHRLAVNPASIKHGHTCWTDYPKGKKNELMGEDLVPFTQAPTPPHELPDYGWDWKQLMSIDMKFVNGPHKGEQVLYKTSSNGGLGMMEAIIDAVVARSEEGHTDLVPIITLDSDHYDHPNWGRTYKPLFDIVDWTDEETLAGGDEEEEEEAEEKPAPKRSRKAKPEPEPEEEDDGIEDAEVVDEDEGEEAEEEAEEEAPRRRRRR